jgi:hypothetical protein
MGIYEKIESKRIQSIITFKFNLYLKIYASK